MEQHSSLATFFGKSDNIQSYSQIVDYLLPGICMTKLVQYSAIVHAVKVKGWFSEATES